MIKTLDGKTPVIDKSCYIAESGTVIGDVVIGKDSSVWFSAVIRGDLEAIRIGENTNIQDNATIHCDASHVVSIGNNVSVGHNAVVHGATIGDNVLIGMNSTVLNGAVIGSGCIIGAGAMVPERMQIPDNSLVVGVPAKILKPTTPEQVDYVIRNANNYRALSKKYLEED